LVKNRSMGIFDFDRHVRTVLSFWRSDPELALVLWCFFLLGRWAVPECSVPLNSRYPKFPAMRPKILAVVFCQQHFSSGTRSGTRRYPKLFPLFIDLPIFAQIPILELPPTFCQGAEQALGPAKADLSNMRSMLFQRSNTWMCTTFV
jgi:hypothetical protein